MRAKNATKNPPTEELPFTCIEGAKNLVASAAAVLTAAYMLA